MKRIFIISTLSFSLLAGCQQKQEDQGMREAASSELALEEIDAAPAMKQSDQVAEQAIASPQVPVVSPKKIVRSGNLSIESKDIHASKKHLDAVLQKFQGYYEQESTNNSQHATQYSLIVRIPSKSFDSFMQSLETGKDKITEKNIQSTDVSIQYYDVESRLKSKRTYLEKYQQMVSSAKSVKDLLEIQEQIRQLQEDIDANESQLRSLSGQVDFSTLHINLFEEQANLPMGSNSFWMRVKDSLTFGWQMLEGLALVLIGIWPIFILGAILFVGIRKWQKRRKVK